MKKSLKLLTCALSIIGTTANSCDQSSHDSHTYILDIQELDSRLHGKFGALELSIPEYQNMIARFKNEFEKSGAREVDLESVYAHELCAIGNHIFNFLLKSSEIKLEDNAFLARQNRKRETAFINVLTNAAHATLGQVRRKSHPKHPSKLRIHSH